MTKLAETPQGQLRISRMTQRMDHFVAEQIGKVYQRDLEPKGRIEAHVDNKAHQPRFQPFLPYDAAPEPAPEHEAPEGRGPVREPEPPRSEPDPHGAGGLRTE